MADFDKNGIDMSLHEAQAAVELEKAMGVDFMYTDFAPERVNFMNLYFIKSKPTKVAQRQRQKS